MKPLSLAAIKKEEGHQEALFFTQEGILFKNQKQSPLLPLAATIELLAIMPESAYFDDSRIIMKCKIALTKEQLLEKGFSLLSSRDYFLTLRDQEETQQIVLRSAHWSIWNESHLYCHRCGSPVHQVLETVEKKCTTCSTSFFPKLSPAVLVLIQRGDEILLGRSANFSPGIYSVLAGFIDMGESAEEAVHREVKEEVGLKITNLKYFGTQSWPFPDSFMIAFKAEYLSGDIKIDPQELEDARWFSLKNLPELPPLPSLSRKLIESFRAF